MRLFRFLLSKILLVCTLASAISVSPSPAQEKPSDPGRLPAPSAKDSTAVPAQAASAKTAAAKSQDRKSGEGPEDSDLLRKRDEWFYKQRSSANGHIPAGARFKAFQHMQRMMLGEGKLVQLADGTFAAASPQAVGTPVWSSMGPTPTTGDFFSPVTGRITTIAVDPSDASANTVLIGGAQGGIWRSTDAGQSWTAVGDQNPSLAMGSIAFAPSQPTTVYAGTGEQAFIGFDIYYGAGVLKSSDGGKTWTPTCTVAGPTCPFIGPYLDSLNPGFGFFNFGGARISYVAVNPENPNLVLVAAQLGVEGPTEGIYCSSDAGAHWSNILPDETATFVGFASSTVAFAAFGTAFGSSPNAPHGNGIYKSVNANSCSASFTLLGDGLPAQSSVGRIDIGISPNFATDNTVYASISDSSGASQSNLGVWVTGDGGNSWTQTAAPDICQPQCWYDNVIKVDPNSKSVAFFGGSAATDNNGAPMWVIRTSNGGNTWSSVIPNPAQPIPGLPHVDNHALAFAKLPSSKVRMYLGNDGGIWRTDDAEATPVQWINLNNPGLTLTQFYPTISIHSATPLISFGGTQDNSSQQLATAPSWVANTGTFETPSGPMQSAVCGDGTSTAIDPLIPSTVYISCQFTSVNASYQTGAAGSFSFAVNGIDPSEPSGFIPPLVADPNQPNVVYTATTRVYRSLDAANFWNGISSFVANGQDVINTLAVGAANSSVLYVGLNTGAVLIATGVTPGGFANFVQTGNPAALPPRSVTAIAVDPSDATGMTAYASFSGFAFVGKDALNPNISINDPLGHIFKTIDGGNTWKDVSCSTADCSKPAASDLPNLPVNDVVIDPELPGVTYAATDLGVFVSNCSASPCSWSTLGTGLPRVAVLSLRLHDPSRTLRAATHGRGAWDIFLNNFSFSGPHLASLSPTSANAGSAPLKLTVNGSGLTGGTVNFGGTAHATTVVQADTQLSATVPTNLLTPGSQKVTVTTGNPPNATTSNALPFEALSLAPVIAACNSAIPTPISSCSTPVQNGSTPVQLTLTGQNFTKGAEVIFDGFANGLSVQVNSSTSLTVTVPTLLLGGFGSTNDVVVFGLPPGGGTSQPATFKVVAPPPPNDNFTNATNITTLNFHDVQDSSGATTEASDPVPPCARQFTKAQGNTGGHSNGTYNTIWYKFTPAFSSNLSVDTSGSTYDTVLSIWTGSGGSLANIACNDDAQPGILQSQIIGLSLIAGTTYYIMVSSFGPPDPNPIALGGQSNFNFLYDQGLNPTPAVTSISPTTATSGGPAFTLTVNGSNFLPGASVFFFNSLLSPTTSETTTFVSSAQLTAQIQPGDIALPGTYNVTVQNPQPTFGFANPANFTLNLGTYPVPTLNSIGPTSVLATTPGIMINALGNNFAPTAVLNFNGVPEPTTVTNPANLSAMIPASQIAAANVGTVQVTVSNPSPGGGPSLPQQFQIMPASPIPTVTSISPSSVPINPPNPITVTVTGTNFQQGAQLFTSPAGNAHSATLTLNVN